MSMPLSQFGTLSSLPPELRLYIYEQALSNGTASLMRTSRAIYNEIKPRLYDTLDIHVYPRHNDPWIRVSFRRLPNTSWSLMEEAHCFRARGGLRNLPYNRFKLTRVNIHAPDPKDLGQLMYLWVKIESFVQVLLKQRTLKYMGVEMNLRPYKDHVWTTGQQRTLERLRANQLHCGCTNDNPLSTYPLPLSPRWDFDFFWISFARLNKNQYQEKTLSDGSVHCLIDLIESIQVFFGTELDTLKGKEAEALRFRRLTTRVLDHVERGGLWPYEDRPESVKAWLPERPIECVPQVVRGLLTGTVL
ncbi:hypothetical protein BDW62DRAFT_201003 [Aspergillus aurantiobrunneus]